MNLHVKKYYDKFFIKNKKLLKLEYEEKNHTKAMGV